MKKFKKKSQQTYNLAIEAEKAANKSEKLSDSALKISIFALVCQIIIAILANLDNLIPL